VRTGVGANYLDCCMISPGEHGEDTSAVAVGLARVLRSQAAAFTSNYPCHGPTQQRWVSLRVTALPVAARW
jgi:hypothetical protein